MNILRHITEDYAKQLGWTNVRPHETDQRMVLADRGATRIVVTIKYTGRANTSAYRHWATLHRSHYLAIAAERPANREYFTLMVGLLEDGEPWWSALWSEAAIKRHIEAAEEMDDGRWYRCRPDLFPDAIVDTYDFIQPGLGLPEPAPAPEPAPPAQTKFTMITNVPDGARVGMVGTVVKHNRAGSVTVNFGTVQGSVEGIFPVVVLGDDPMPF